MYNLIKVLILYIFRTTSNLQRDIRVQRIIQNIPTITGKDKDRDRDRERERERESKESLPSIYGRFIGKRQQCMWNSHACDVTGAHACATRQRGQCLRSPLVHSHTHGRPGRWQRFLFAFTGFRTSPVPNPLRRREKPNESLGFIFLPAGFVSARNLAAHICTYSKLGCTRANVSDWPESNLHFFSFLIDERVRLVDIFQFSDSTSVTSGRFLMFDLTKYVSISHTGCFIFIPANGILFYEVRKKLQLYKSRNCTSYNKNTGIVNDSFNYAHGNVGIERLRLLLVGHGNYLHMYRQVVQLIE